MKIRRPASHHDAQAFLDYGDRIVDGDTAPPTSDLESTFLRVQRAMRAGQPVPDAMPDHLRMRTWEDTMQNSVAIPGQRESNRTRQRAFHAGALPRMGWTSAANVALTVLIVIAGFGAWRVFEGGTTGGGISPGPSGSRYAVAPMTPVSMATAEIVDGTCDVGTSVPLYQGVDSPLTDGTALYVTVDGRLMLHCNGWDEDSVLATEVQDAQPYGVPDILRLRTGSGEETSQVFLNVATGEQMSVNMEGFTSYLGHTNQSQRFLIAPAPDDPFSWGVYDIERMTSISLADVTGAGFPTNGNLVVSAPENANAIAFAMGTYRTEGSANITGDKGGAGDVVVVDENLATATWVTIPADFPSTTNISLSDDGSKLAIISNPFNAMDPQHVDGSMISILDVATGKEIIRTDPFTTPNGAFFTWVEDGAAAVYASDSAVYRIPAEGGASPTKLYQTNTTLRYIDAFMDPNILLIQEEVTPSGRESRVLTVRTDTGDATSFEGNAWSPGTTPLIPFHVQLAPIVIQAEDQGVGSWNIVDPRTGEMILSAGSELSTPAMDQEADGNHMFQRIRITASNAPVSVVLPGDGRTVIIDLGNEEPMVNEETLPEGIQADGYKIGTISLAPDGSILMVETKLDDATRYWTLDLSDENTEWTQFPDGVKVSYLHPAD